MSDRLPAEPSGFDADRLIRHPLLDFDLIRPTARMGLAIRNRNEVLGRVTYEQPWWPSSPKSRNWMPDRAISVVGLG